MRESSFEVFSTCRAVLSNCPVSFPTPSCEESRERRWTMGLASARVAQHLRASSEMTAIRDGVGAFPEATAAQPISATRIMTHGHDSERLSLPRAGSSPLSAFTKYVARCHIRGPPGNRMIDECRTKNHDVQTQFPEPDPVSRATPARTHRLPGRPRTRDA